MKHTIIPIAAACLLTACGGGKGASEQTPADSVSPVQSLAALLDSASASGRFYFGHHDDTAYGHRWAYAADSSDVRNVTGQYPGLMSWDLGLIEVDSARNLDGVPFDFIASQIAAQHTRGGINAISWHPLNPISHGNSWDVSTTPLKSFATDKALADTMDLWIGRAARFIASLKDDEGNSLPVIFRPWHENSGSWFWWGADHGSPEEYIALWHRTREVFDSIGVNNVLWAYSPDKDLTLEQYLATYPGDDYVDILGTDIYHFGGEAGVAEYTSRIKSQLPFVAEEAAKRGKLVAFTETGLEGLELADWYTRVLLPAIDGIPVAYVCVWRNAIESEKPDHFYVPYTGHPAEADFKKFHSSPRPIFVD